MAKLILFDDDRNRIALFDKWLMEHYDEVDEDVTISMLDDGVAELDYDYIYDTRFENECERRFNEYLTSLGN